MCIKWFHSKNYLIKLASITHFAKRFLKYYNKSDPINFLVINGGKDGVYRFRKRKYKEEIDK